MPNMIIRLRLKEKGNLSHNNRVFIMRHLDKTINHGSFPSIRRCQGICIFEIMDIRNRTPSLLSVTHDSMKKSFIVNIERVYEYLLRHRESTMTVSIKYHYKIFKFVTDNGIII